MNVVFVVADFFGLTLVLVHPRMISPGDMRSISEKGAVEVMGREGVGRMLRMPLLFGT